MSGRRTDNRVYRIMTTPNNTEVRKKSEMDAWIMIDACCILVRRSRARRSRGPPAHSVLEKQGRTD